VLRLFNFDVCPENQYSCPENTYYVHSPFGPGPDLLNSAVSSSSRHCSGSQADASHICSHLRLLLLRSSNSYKTQIEASRQNPFSVLNQRSLVLLQRVLEMRVCKLRSVLRLGVIFVDIFLISLSRMSRLKLLMWVSRLNCESILLHSSLKW
jgi:hypothetical protein